MTTFTPWYAALVILLICGIQQVHATPNTLILNGEKDRYCLEDYCEFYIDPTGSSQVSEVLKTKEFKSYNNTNFNKSDIAVWVRFRISNQSQKTDSIFINGQFFDEINLYDINSDSNTKLVSESGYMIPFKERAIQEWGAIVGDRIQPNETKTYLLHLKSNTYNSRQLAPYLTSTCIKTFTMKGFDENHRLPKLFLYFFIGAISMISLYNFGISLTTQFKEYRLLSAYNFLFVAGTFLVTNQHIELSWVNPFSMERSLRFMPGIALLAVYILFAVKFLDLKKYNPGIAKILKILVIPYSLMIVGLLAGLFDYVYICFTIVTTIAFIIILLQSIKLSKTRITARFFLIGNILICTVALFQVGSLYGIISSTQLTVFSGIALMMELVVFSFAVAYKFNVSKKEMAQLKFRNQLQKERLHEERDMKRDLALQVEEKARALSSSSIQWLNMSDKLYKLEQNIEENFKELDPENTKKLKKQIEEIKDFEDQWNSFKIHFESVHQGFFAKLECRYPHLTQNDLKICAFMKMKLSNKEMAIILNVTKKAIEQAKRRMRKKLGLEPEENILKYVEMTLNSETQKS